MGLDTVDLLVAVEKTFNIEISDYEASNIVTVGDFYDAVWNKIKHNKSTSCKSAGLFYEFRGFLMNRYEVLKEEFKLETNLNLIIPKDNRIIEWQSIQQNLGYKLPDLNRPDWVNNTILYTGLLTIIGGFFVVILAINFHEASNIWWLIPVAGILITIFLDRISKPFRTIINPNDFKGFIETVLALNYNKISGSNGTNRKEMENVMRMIIHDRAGVELSEIIPEAQIVHDLGLD